MCNSAIMCRSCALLNYQQSQFQKIRSAETTKSVTRDLIKLKVLYELAHTFLNQAYERENVLTRVVSGLQSGLKLVFIFTESFRLSPNRQFSKYAGMENRLIQFKEMSWTM